MYRKNDRGVRLYNAKLYNVSSRYRIISTHCIYQVNGIHIRKHRMFEINGKTFLLIRLSPERVYAHKQNIENIFIWWRILIRAHLYCGSISNTNYSITSNVQDNLCVQIIMTRVATFFFFRKDYDISCPKGNRVPSLGFNIEGLV